MARRRLMRSQRRRFQWQGGFAYTEGFIFPFPTIAGSSAFSAYWVRPPAGVLDTISNDFVALDWTVVKQLNRGTVSIIENLGSFQVWAQVFMGVIAWDNVDDTDPAPLQTPLPSEPGWDWLWWWSEGVQEYHPGPNIVDSRTNSVNPDGFNITKAQRKLSASTGLLGVVEVKALVGGIDADWGYSHWHRYGYKLP